MADNDRDRDRISRNTSRESTPEADRGNLTAPHGDELAASAADDSPAGSGATPLHDGGRREDSFGRTDRYSNQDDPDAETPVLDTTPLGSQEEMSADARRRLMDQIDDAAADDARMATRKRQHSAD